MLTVIAIIWVLIWALLLVDVFHRDWSTGVKLLWAFGMLVFPVVGVIAYLIVRPSSSTDVHGVIGSAEAPAGERSRDHHPV